MIKCLISWFSLYSTCCKPLTVRHYWNFDHCPIRLQLQFQTWWHFLPFQGQCWLGLNQKNSELTRAIGCLKHCNLSFEPWWHLSWCYAGIVRFWLGCHCIIHQCPKENQKINVHSTPLGWIFSKAVWSFQTWLIDLKHRIILHIRRTQKFQNLFRQYILVVYLLSGGLFISFTELHYLIFNTARSSRSNTLHVSLVIPCKTKIINMT